MSGPDPAVAAVRTAVRAALADLPEGALVLVGCSGGADSLALAAATAFVSSRAGLRARAVVVDHGLQPGSAQVAAAALAACSGLGLPGAVVPVQVTGDGRGPEAAARSARYAALGTAARESGAAAVLLGHTRDDQAEQVLLGLARGSGARSLAGMPAARDPFRRPLLGVPRAVTEQACRALGLRPWDDPANADPAYARSRVRRRVLPVLEAELGPGVAAALARTADQLREDAETLEGLARRLLEDAVVPAGDRPGPEGLALDVEVLAAAPAALRRRALRAAVVRAGSPAGSLTREHVLRCDALLADWHGQGPVHLPGRVVVRRACGRLALAIT
jgi:tRNA(Ile)-lysidine synthase